MSDFLKKLSDKCLFKIIKHKYNLGTSSSIATGIEHASGNYIAILAHDDHFFSKKIEKQLNYLKNNLEKKCVFSAMETFDNKKKITANGMSKTINLLEDFKKFGKKKILKNIFIEKILLLFTSKRF